MKMRPLRYGTERWTVTGKKVDIDRFKQAFYDYDAHASTSSETSRTWPILKPNGTREFRVNPRSLFQEWDTLLFREFPAGEVKSES